MHVFLTGGTGLIGSGVLSALLAEGHSVSALARSESSATELAAAGARVVRGDLVDLGIIAAGARGADAVVHTALPGDHTNAEVDAGVVDTVLHTLSGTGKAFLHTSGVWTYGSGELDEQSPFAWSGVTAWRLPLDARVRAAAADGVRGVVIAPGIVYGTGRGLPALIRSAPRDDDGALRLPGSGEQRWTTVHTADLGRLYAAALEHAAPASYYLGVSGHNPTVREIGVAADLGAGGEGRVRPSTPEESEELFGWLARPFRQDQRASGSKARAELGWSPSEPTLLEELERGSYATALVGA
jgi:nucleoside-diphosphate-sugar epimerase